MGVTEKIWGALTSMTFPHCQNFKFCDLITFVHRTFSSRMMRVSASGDDGDASAPCTSSGSAILRSASARRSSALTKSMMARGVRAGT